MALGVLKVASIEVVNTEMERPSKKHDLEERVVELTEEVFRKDGI